MKGPSLFCLLAWAAAPAWALPIAVPTSTPAKVLTPTPVPKAKVPKTLLPTPTQAWTETPLGTPTPEWTATSTPTSTVTATTTLTSSATPTPTPGVFQFQVPPKPDGEGKLRFQWGTNIPAEEVFIKIYSSGFRVVHGFEFNRERRPELLSPGVHEIGWDGRDEQGRRIPPGTYLCFIDVRAGGKRFEATGKVEFP